MKICQSIIASVENSKTHKLIVIYKHTHVVSHVKENEVNTVLIYALSYAIAENAHLAINKEKL